MTRTRAILDLLGAYESRNVTFRDPDGTWPIVWERALGCRVWDVEGRCYLDLTAAFGVAAAGHAAPRVVRAGQRQMGRLLHAMGDVHPHPLKAELARALSRLTFGRWGARGKVIFASAGFEAVEAALKTALLATGKPGVVAFEGAYHGLGYGALNATHRDDFRSPFRRQLREFATFVPFPLAGEEDDEGRGGSERAGQAGSENGLGTAVVERRLRQVLSGGAVGAVLVEPVQGRGGIRVPPPDFLPMVRRVSEEYGALLVLDEIYTGFGRTGRWFACEHASVVPDVICLGKALAGGFPLSVCVGRAEVMDAAWPESTGEAIHTSTFLGHPVGCAMALAQIAEIRRLRLVPRSERLGRRLRRGLAGLGREVGGLRLSARGLGLMAGVELRRRDGCPATEETLAVVKGLLREGWLCLPEGAASNVIGFTPPLTISERQLEAAVCALGRAVAEVAGRRPVRCGPARGP
ncbi:MAG: aspartate aminotransferase family protein [Verrucomicrobiales bacterium]|nr:aspartate aminotransferase family protein [Verrucomicrobiales bacterium]